MKRKQTRAKLSNNNTDRKKLLLWGLKLESSIQLSSSFPFLYKLKITGQQQQCVFSNYERQDYEKKILLSNLPHKITIIVFF